MSQFFKQTFLASGRKQTLFEQTVKLFKQMSQSFEQMLIFFKTVMQTIQTVDRLHSKAFLKCLSK